MASARTIAHWDTADTSESRVRVVYIDHFDARGMRRVYSRGDHYGRGRMFHMDVWLTGDGRLLTHYGSRRAEMKAQLLELLATMYPQHAGRQASPTD